MLETFITNLLTQLKANLTRTEKGVSTLARVPVKGPLAERTLNVNFWIGTEPTTDPFTGMALKGGYTVKLDPALPPPFGTGQGISGEFSKVIPIVPSAWGGMVFTNPLTTALWGSQDNPLSGFPCVTNSGSPFQMPLG